MSYPLEPERPRDPTPPPAPLPRLQPPGIQKGEEETSRQKEPAREKPKTLKRITAGAETPESVKEPSTSRSGRTKLEETPVLDTHGSRQKARIIIGALGTGFLLLVCAMIYQRFSASALVSDGDDLSSQPTAVNRPGPAVDGVRVEREARNMYDQARQIALNGNPPLAVTMLERVTTTYPESEAAQDAQRALDRSQQSLPLFPTSAAVAVKAAEPSTPPPPPVVEQVVVEATAPVGPAPATAEVQLGLPANPAEPGRPSSASVSQDVPAQTRRPLPAGFRARVEAGVDASGWPLEIVGDRDGASMVLVPAGEFIMGRDDGEPAERPSHRVSLATYYIDQHEVTVRQYSLFQKEVGARGGTTRAIAVPGPDAGEADAMPKVMVSAIEARNYAEWCGKRLPTEAEWEMAARTPDGRIHPWGMDPPSWEKPRPPRKIDPVMSFPSDVSPYHVFDLAGNAWEWTSDWFDPRYYQQFRGSAVANPTGPDRRPRSQLLTVKGGSKLWIASWREGLKPETRLPYVGFRCVLPVEAPANTPASPGGPAPGGPAGVDRDPRALVPF